MTSGIWWTGLFPGLAIVLTVLGLTLVGESMNDLNDPRLRTRSRSRSRRATAAARTVAPETPAASTGTAATGTVRTDPEVSP